MKEKSCTVAELAKELNVSKTTISKKINALGLRSELSKIGNRFVISEHVKTMIIKSFQEENANLNANQNENQSQTETQTVCDSQTQIIEMLRAELMAKDTQIAKLNEIVLNAQTTAQNAQKLQLIAESKLKAIELQQTASNDDNASSMDHVETTTKKNFFSRFFKSN